MGRPVTRFVDDKSVKTAVDAKTKRELALLSIAAIVSVLFIFDAAALGGRLRQMVWRDAQTEAHMSHRMMQFAGPGR
jgi:hypothetical protein